MYGTVELLAWRLIVRVLNSHNYCFLSPLRGKTSSYTGPYTPPSNGEIQLAARFRQSFSAYFLTLTFTRVLQLELRLKLSLALWQTVS